MKNIDSIDKKINLSITDHAYQRAKERLSISKKSVDRLADSAFENGIRHSDIKGQFKRYIDKLYFQYKTANNIRIYGEIIFLFANNTLITLYQVPQEFRKTLKNFK